jgi:hypothetical protein
VRWMIWNSGKEAEHRCKIVGILGNTVCACCIQVRNKFDHPHKTRTSSLTISLQFCPDTNSNQIQPPRQSISSLALKYRIQTSDILPIPSPRNLQLNHRHSSLVIISTQLLIRHSILPIRQYRRTNKRIRLPRPVQTRGHGISDIDPFQPALCLVFECSCSDLGSKYVSPALGVVKRIASNELFGHVGVPNVVEIGDYSAEIHRDGVSAHGEPFVVEWLVDVSYELLLLRIVR